MQLAGLWASVKFRACNGGTDSLLTLAAQQGLHLYTLDPSDGGFCASCVAWHYRPLAGLARRHSVHLRIEKKLGFYFWLRPLLHRTGLWFGGLLFWVLLLWSQSLVWSIDTSTLSTGQTARASAALRMVGLQPGSIVTEQKLAAAEYALLQSGEFSWASVNFAKGRLQIEAAAAKPKPEIATGSSKGLRARCDATVVSVHLTSGTMLVTPGQQVEAGQGLIGTARSERDGTLIFVPAAGSVLGRFEWSDTQEVPLFDDILQLTGVQHCIRTLTVADHSWTIPFSVPLQSTLPVSRHCSITLFDLPLPCSVTETTYYEQQSLPLIRSPQQALDLARLQSLQSLSRAFPDAELLARQETTSVTDDLFLYTVVYTLCADICT